MSLEELAELMESALSTVERKRPTVEKKARKKRVKPSGVRKEEIIKIVREEVSKAVSELKRELLQLVEEKVQPVDVDEVVSRVLERLEEEKRRKQSMRSRRALIELIDEKDIEEFMPLLMEFSYNKRKMRGKPRAFVPSEFYQFLKEKGIDRSYEWVRALIRVLYIRGILEKSSEARYRIKI